MVKVEQGKARRAPTSPSAAPSHKRKRVGGDITSSSKKEKIESQDCDICAETKAIYRNFPSLSTCPHDPTVCAKCFEQHFVLRIEASREAGWSVCTCPLCAKQIKEEDAQALLPRQVCKRLQDIIDTVSSYRAQPVDKSNRCLTGSGGSC